MIQHKELVGRLAGCLIDLLLVVRPCWCSCAGTWCGSDDCAILLIPAHQLTKSTKPTNQPTNQPHIKKNSLRNRPTTPRDAVLTLPDACAFITLGDMASDWKGAGSAILYGVLSAALTFLNKVNVRHLLATYHMFFFNMTCHIGPHN